METPANEPWFFSHEGVQGGPLTFEELRSKAQAGELNPRLDLVWTQGMEDWKPAGEVEGLFERRASAESAGSSSTAARNSPYSPPEQGSGAEIMAGYAGEWPGVRRRGYIFGAIVFPFLIGVVLAILELQEIALDPTLSFALEMVVPSVILLYVTIQRLPNLGMSRWWTLGIFVPFLNFWLGYRLFACPAGYAYQKKLDPAGITLAVIYWLMMVFIILMFAVVIAVYTGTIGDPELREALMDALREAYPNLPAE